MQTKVCTKCNKEKMATTDFFCKMKNGRLGLSNQCKVCRSAYARKYNKDNREQVAKRMKQYRTDNKESIAKYHKEYHIKNKEAIIQYHKEYHELNKEKLRPVRQTADQKRRSLKRQLPATLTKDEWLQCIAYFNNCCCYCGEFFELLEQEHFVPLYNGGIFARDNILPACRSCNASKLHKPFEEWYPAQPFYTKAREDKIMQYLSRA